MIKQLLLKLMNKFSRKSVKTAGFFVSGNLLVAVIGGISGLLYGRWIDPDTLGEFGKYSILTGYLTVGIIFVDTAFSRHFPYYLGKKDEKKALEVASIAKWWYLFLAFLGLIIFGVLAVKGLLNGNINEFLGWTVQIFAYAIATYGLFLKVLYRSNDDFLKLNKNMLITAGAGVVVLPLVYFFKYAGLTTRSIIQNSVNLYTHFRNAPYKVKAKFDLKELIGLAKISLPFQIPVYLDNHLVKATVSLIIVKALGEAELGIYSMAIMLQGFLLVFSRSLVQMINTKLKLKYGENDDFGKTFSYIIKPVLISTSIGAILVLGFIFCIGPLVHFLMPKYIDAIKVVQILSLEVVTTILISPFALFVVALMYKEMAFVRVLKALVVLLLIYLFHDNLTQIATILVIVNVVNVITGYLIILYTIRKEKTVQVKS